MLYGARGSVFSVLSSTDGNGEHRIFDYQQVIPQIEVYHFTDIPPEYWIEKFQTKQNFGEIKTYIIENYDDQWIQMPFLQTPDQWQLFCKGLSSILDHQEIAPILTKQFVQLPQDLTNLQKIELQSFTVILEMLIELCRISDVPQRLLKYISNHLLPKYFYVPLSAKKEFIALITPVKLYKNKFFSKPEEAWAVMSKRQHLTVFETKQFTALYDDDVASIGQSFGKLRFISNSKSEIIFKCEDEDTQKMWLNSLILDHTWLDSLSCDLPKNYPPNFINAFNSCLFADDMLVIQSLFSCQLASLDNWDAIIDALLTVGIAYDRLDVLISFISFDEISQTSDPNLILRSNSICTHFLKVYYKRFGREYITNIIIPLFKDICEIPIDDLTFEGNEIEIIRKYINEFCDRILGSLDKIPRAIRHLATHIFYATQCTQGTWEATFNSITNLFILRYTMAAFSSPIEMPINIVKPEKYKKVILPFSAIMLNILSGLGLSSKYEYLRPLERDILQLRPKLLDFFSNLPLRRNEPGQYIMPSKDEIRNSTKLILDAVIDNREQFLQKYRNFAASDTRYHPFSYRILHLLYSCLVHTEL